MKSCRLFVALVTVLAAACLVASVSFAGKDKDKKEAGHHEYDAEKMAAWQKTMSPGSHHKHLKNLVGEWHTKVSMWQEPGAEAMVTEGKATCEMIMNGRFVVQHMTGQMMGMPFTGMGIVGYDNTTKMHTSVWFDNMGTQMMYTEGDCENHCKVETHYASQMGPSGEPMKFKLRTNIIDKNKHIFEMYMIGEKGEEFKQMEIVYTRS